MYNFLIHITSGLFVLFCFVLYYFFFFFFFLGGGVNNYLVQFLPFSLNVYVIVFLNV